MYYAAVAALMLVLPLASIAVETSLLPQAAHAALAIKWFGFWAVGARLTLAGLRQVFQPAYTADVILGLGERGSLVLARELGFANLALGSVALTGLLLPAWRLPAAFAGGLFCLLAGINHVFQRQRNRLQNVAMVSDLFVGAVLNLACLRTLVLGGL
ncbi:MAG TPA: DUF6790 family protein [Burkholderiaceae bacterium]|nr:DUF6790 family protein [Burkholderiaceae bacterium]